MLFRIISVNGKIAELPTDCLSEWMNYIIGDINTVTIPSIIMWIGSISINVICSAISLQAPHFISVHTRISFKPFCSYSTGMFLREVHKV